MNKCLGHYYPFHGSVKTWLSPRLSGQTFVRYKNTLLTFFGCLFQWFFFSPDKIEPIVKVLYSSVSTISFMLPSSFNITTKNTNPWPFQNKGFKLILLGINISHLGKRKIIFKIPFLGGYVSSQEGNPPGFHEKQVTSQHIWHWQSRCDDMDKQSSGSQPQKSSKMSGKVVFGFRF